MKIDITHDSRTEPAPVVTITDTKPPVIPPTIPQPDRPQIVARIVTRPYALIIGAVLPDTSNHLLQIGFNDSGARYVRGQQTIELAGQTTSNPHGVGPTVTLRAFIETTANATTPQLTFGVAWTAVFTLKPYGSSTSIMLTPVAVAATEHWVDLTFDKSSLPEGWYMVTCTGMPVGWDVLDYPMYIRHATKATPQSHMPVVCGSYTHALHGSRHAHAWVRAQFEPTEVPLPPREFPPWPSNIKYAAKPVAAIPGAPTPEEVAAIKAWTDDLTMTQFAYTMLVPMRQDDIYRPSVLPSGLWSTATVQNYFASSFTELHAPWQHIDGARGRGNLTCVTAIRGTRRPEGNKVIYMHPWAKGVMHDNGTIETHAGWVHDMPPPYANYNRFQVQRPPAPRRLVGDWSGTTVKGVHESWGLAVDYRTTVTDPTQLPPIGGEPPHPGDVMEYFTDTRNDRVRLVTHDGQDRSLPARVTDFVVGATGSHPWDCETVGNLLIVTWRNTGQVIAYDMDNDAAVVWSVAIPSPEGVRVKDGAAYVGSSTLKAVMKFDINVRAVTKFIDVLWANGQSLFVNIGVTDGTHGNAFLAYVTWTNGQYGWPVVVDITGKRLAIGARNNTGWGETKGSYCPHTMSYPTAVEMHNGRIIWGSVQDTLHQISLALSTDQAIPQIVHDERKKYDDDDRKITDGDLGFGLYGYPVPWGMGYDNFLAAVGHAKPEEQ